MTTLSGVRPHGKGYFGDMPIPFSVAVTVQPEALFDSGVVALDSLAHWAIWHSVTVPDALTLQDTFPKCAHKWLAVVA